MKTRRIGEDTVSALGVGAMSFSPFFGPVDESACHEVLDVALDAGVTHVDVANIYGMGAAETVLGNWLRERGVRDRVHIATKAGIRPGAERGFDNDPAYLETELDGSLRRLGTDHVDLFYVHRREAERPIEEITEGLACIVATGKARAIGFSEIAPATLHRARAVHPVAAVQSEYSLQTRSPELGMVEACERTGTALVAFSPVGRGLLTDQPLTRQRVDAQPFLKQIPRFSAENLPSNVAASEPLRRLATEVGLTAAGLAVAWVLDRSPSVVAIPGTAKPGHMRGLIDGALWEMTDEMRAALDREMPAGWCEGARYSEAQARGPEHFC